MLKEQFILFYNDFNEYIHEGKEVITINDINAFT
jgi:hypothetical protein